MRRKLGETVGIVQGEETRKEEKKEEDEQE